MPQRRRSDARRMPEGYPHGPAAALASVDALASLDDPRAIVLVEGVSDRIAVDTAARRLGREPVAVVPVGGAQGLRRMLRAIRSQHPGAALAGLYDIGEESVVRSALAEAGLVEPDGAARTAAFFACRTDLEDELIRACGTELVVACVERSGDARAFARMRQQPEWRGRPTHEQLHRWISSGASRKLRYARILVDAVPLERMPSPLVDVLTAAHA